MWRRHYHGMLIGIVDVGSNTVRLLLTHCGRSVLTRREMLRLGVDVERSGRISAEKLEHAAVVVAGYAEEARAAGGEHLEVLITSPGRQAANGEELRRRLELAAGFPARILSAAEEGSLAFVGAVGLASPPPQRVVGVVDVGGGSAQIVTGTRRDGPTWSRSIDLGSQRLTSRLLFADPPGRDAIEGGRAEVDRCLDALSPPEAHTWYAVGGSARALRRIAGPRLGTAELAAALTMLAKTPGAEVGRIYGIDEDRARTLTAGAVIVAAVQARLGASLEVVRGGLRDGAVREIAAQIRR